MAVSTDNRAKTKKYVKLEKCKKKKKFRNMSNIKVRVMPISIRAIGTLSIKQETGLDELEILRKINIVEITAVLGILRKLVGISHLPSFNFQQKLPAGNMQTITIRKTIITIILSCRTRNWDKSIRNKKRRNERKKK